MKKTFYSNGKLLLTGEYLVLDGAKALALPTKFGQNLVIESGKNGEIAWKSIDSDRQVWFAEVLSFPEIKADKNPQALPSIKNTLLDILHEAFLLNPDFLKSGGYTATTHLTFPKFWGLGTSSTLINNIAQWAKVDAFELLKNSFGGSGYDIACAQNDTPILYHLEEGKPVVEQAGFYPVFTNHLYFVYLNRKQSSKAAIASYYANRQERLSNKIAAIDRITNALLHAPDAATFAHQLEKHETVISDIVEMQTVKEAFFPDFKGVVKSLGGWGGDFVLAVSKDDPTTYFTDRGFATVIPYDDMILK